MKKYLMGLCAIFVAANMVFAADMSLDDLINKIQGNQKKIKDMYAETTTKITSNLQLTTDNKSKVQTMTQKGKMWTKGEDKSKIEMLSPMKQVTITNGDKMAIINSDTGQKMIQDLKKMREKSGMGDSSKQMSLEKAKDFFNLSTTKKGDDYVITGIPRQQSKFLGKMEFYVDSEKWVPVKILMYDAKGKVMSQSVIEYQKILIPYSEAPSMARSEGVWVPVKNRSNVVTPAGKMEIEMVFSNVKINQGMNDREFKID